MSPLLFPAAERSRSGAQIPPVYPPVSRQRTPEHVLTIGAITAALLLASLGAILFFFDPARSNFYPVCIFHQVTGLQCPGCGGLRAVHQLLHGHFMAALRLNFLAVVFVPFVGLFCAMLVLRRIRQGQSALTIRPSWLWCVFGLVLAFGILRNLPSEPFTWLAPH